MNWNAIAAIAEVVAATGVIITLLYLAVQIRQNTKALRAATFQNIIGLATGFAETLARDKDFAALLQTGMADLDALEEAERFRFHWQLVALLRRYENIHYHSTLGLLDGEQWEGLRASLNYIMLRPGCRAWWSANSFLFNPGFRSFVDERIRLGGEQPAPEVTAATVEPAIAR